MQLIEHETNQILRWCVSIPNDNLTLVETVKDWATDMDIDCVIGPGFAYFVNYEDAILFMLKWQ